MLTLRPLAALARTAPLGARRYSTDRPLVTLARLADSPLADASRRAAAPAPGAPDARAAAVEPELDAGISLLTLDRAPARNAISMQLLAELEECVETARSNGTRVLVIRSLVPSTFCAGADLRERKGMTPGQVDTFLLSLRRTLSSIERLPFPCLAALDGTALGGGLELALCADVRIAGPGARLGLTETRLGIIPGAGGTHRLTRLVGPARAKDLIFSARILDGQTAHALGVVEHYAPAYNGGEGGDEALMAAVASARQMAGNGPLALKAAKLAIDRGFGMDTETALDWERACYDRLMGTQDRLEGLRAFAEKRRPRYTGE